jgi:hypothetical protein
MRTIKYFSGLALIIVLLVGCRKDNYDEPSSLLTGRLIHNGEVVYVEYDRVSYELFQYGFGSVAPITGTFTEQGTYSQLLFDGEYKFIMRPNQGPFIWGNSGGKPDTVTIQVNGNTTRDIEVTPFYMIRTPNLAHAGGKITGTFKIEQTLTGPNAKSIEKATLFINKTAFVGNSNNIATKEIAGGSIVDPNNISLEVNIPTITPSQNYVFARIGVKTSGVEDWIFSPVQKITF